MMGLRLKGKQQGSGGTRGGLGVIWPWVYVAAAGTPNTRKADKAHTGDHPGGGPVLVFFKIAPRSTVWK